MLTETQIEARRGRLTASRVGPLMSGDAAAIHQLWLEMTGQAEHPDLSLEWPVYLGVTTEQRHLDWLERKHGIAVARRGEFVVHSRHRCFGCTLDGWDEKRSCPIEVKHCSGWENLDVIIERYKAQCHFQMMCCNTMQYVFSVIQGAEKPAVEVFDMDTSYASELLQRALAFMICVESRTPPGPVLPVSSPVAWRDYKMETEEWRRPAEVWLQSRGAVDSCKDAAAAIKSMVPADARRAWGAGVIVTRDRGGRLFLRSDV